MEVKSPGDKWNLPLEEGIIMSIEFKDVSGQARPLRDLEEALDAVQMEMVRGDHSAMFKNGMPAIMIYVVIADALKELIAIRKFLAKKALEKQGGG